MIQPELLTRGQVAEITGGHRNTIPHLARTRRIRANPAQRGAAYPATLTGHIHTRDQANTRAMAAEETPRRRRCASRGLLRPQPTQPPRTPVTPHHLHALAAAWSLHNARQHLAQLARDEQRDIDAARLKPADGLRSPVYGTRHPSGGHSDPMATLLLGAERPHRVNRWAVLLDRADLVTTGVATMLRLTGDDPLSQIIAASPRILPGTAAVVAQHLQDEDGWLRPAIGMWPQREPMPGVPCPACQRRTLHVQTAGPESAWTVVCAADCRCAGDGCRCGMPGAVEATAHIWPRETVLGAGSNGGCHD